MKTNKIIVLFLSFAMMTMSTFTAFAAGAQLTDSVNGEEIIDEIIEEIIEDGDFTEKQEEEIAEDVELIDAFGIDLQNIESAFEDDNEMVYEYNLAENGNAEIRPEKTQKGISLAINEEGIMNTVLLTDEGRLFIDGNEVLIEETIIDEEDSINKVQLSKSETWDQIKNPCPKKEWVYKSTYTDKTVKMGLAFKAIGTLALAIVMNSAGVLASNLTAVAGALDTLGDIYSPNSEAFSCKIKVYHPKGGQQIENGQYVKKKIGQFYTEKNYKGHSTTKTWYTIKEYY